MHVYVIRKSLKHAFLLLNIVCIALQSDMILIFMQYLMTFKFLRAAELLASSRSALLNQNCLPSNGDIMGTAGEERLLKSVH